MGSPQGAAQKSAFTGRWKGAPVDYRLVTTGPDDEAGINGALTRRRGGIDGQAVIAFVNTIQVEDMTETQRRVEAAGGTQVVEPDTVPGVVIVAYFKDTEGNILGALEPAEPFAAAG